MGLSVEQRLAIKFCFKPGRSATKSPQMVNAAYGDQALSRSNAYRWDGREDGNTTTGVAALRSVAMKIMSRRFLKYCFKTITFC
jgi:hypothetical protein